MSRLKYRDNIDISGRPTRDSISSLLTTSTTSTVCSGVLITPASPTYPSFPPVDVIRLDEDEDHPISGKWGHLGNSRMVSLGVADDGHVRTAKEEHEQKPWWTEATPAKLDKKGRREISAFDVSRIVDTGIFSLPSFAPPTDLEDDGHSIVEAALAESPTLGFAELIDLSPVDEPALDDSPTLGAQADVQETGCRVSVMRMPPSCAMDTSGSISDEASAPSEDAESVLPGDSLGVGNGSGKKSPAAEGILESQMTGETDASRSSADDSPEKSSITGEGDVLEKVPVLDDSPTMGSRPIPAIHKLPEQIVQGSTTNTGLQDMDNSNREEFWSAKRLGKRPMTHGSDEPVTSVPPSPSRQSSSRPISTSSGSSASSIRSRTSSRSAPSIPSRGSSKGSITPPATPNRGSSLRDPIHALTTDHEAATSSAPRRLPMLNAILAAPPPQLLLPTRIPHRRAATSSTISSLPTVVEASIELSPRLDFGLAASPVLLPSTSMPALSNAEAVDTAKIFRHRRGGSSPTRHPPDDLQWARTTRPFLSDSRRPGCADMAPPSHRHTASLDITPGANASVYWGTAPYWASMETSNEVRNRVDFEYAYSFPRPAPPPPTANTPTQSSFARSQYDRLDPAHPPSSQHSEEDEADMVTPRPPYSAKSDVKIDFPRADGASSGQQIKGMKTWAQKWKSGSVYLRSGDPASILPMLG